MRICGDRDKMVNDGFASIIALTLRRQVRPFRSGDDHSVMRSVEGNANVGL